MKKKTPSTKTAVPKAKFVKKTFSKPTPTASSLANTVQLLQGYWRFMSLGKYLEHLMKKTDLSTQVEEVNIVTGATSRFGLKKPLLSLLLSQIYAHPDQKNVFGYLVEVSALRGIFSLMRELLDETSDFSLFVQKKLQDQSFSFEQIIRLLRNVLSHTVTSDIRLKLEDFVKQRDFLSHEANPLVKFEFVYAKFFSERKGSPEYGISLQIDFLQLKDGQALIEVIPLHQLYLLAELCYNLSEVYRTIKK